MSTELSAKVLLRPLASCNDCLWTNQSILSHSDFVTPHDLIHVLGMLLCMTSLYCGCIPRECKSVHTGASKLARRWQHHAVDRRLSLNKGAQGMQTQATKQPMTGQPACLWHGQGLTRLFPGCHLICAPCITWCIKHILPKATSFSPVRNGNIVASQCRIRRSSAYRQEGCDCDAAGQAVACGPQDGGWVAGPTHGAHQISLGEGCTDRQSRA